MTGIVRSRQRKKIMVRNRKQETNIVVWACDEKGGIGKQQLVTATGEAEVDADSLRRWHGKI